VLYAAGRTWAHGGNPYDFDTLSRSVAGIPGLDLGVDASAQRFFYPPQSAAIFVPLGLLPYSLGSYAWSLLNVAALAAIVALTWRSIDERPDASSNRWGRWLLVALIIGNPFTVNVLWSGQTSLVAFAATLASWFFANRKHWVLAGACLGLASFKPQICALVVIWIALQRDWKTLLAGSVTAGVLAVVPMAAQGGPIGALRAWRAGVSSEYVGPYNLPTWPHKIGMQSLLSHLHIRVPSLVIMGIGVLCVLALWKARNRIVAFDVLALLMVTTLTFSTHLHDYDYAVLTPVFASLWHYSGRSLAVTAMTTVLVAVLCIPQPLVQLLGHPLLQQWRSGIVIVMGVVILASSARAQGSASARAPLTASR